MVWICQHDALGSNFGLSIDAQRTDGIGFDIVPLATIEDEITGEKKEGYVSRKFGEVCGGIHIETAREFGLGLTIRAATHRGAMNHQSWLLLAKRAADSRAIKQIKLWPGQSNHAPVGSELRRGLDEIVSDESARASDPSE
jgi:hypothetical protein